MNLFLAAAGLGTRFHPFTLTHAKPTIPFLNVPMGLYQFQYLKLLEQSISAMVVNTHHLPEQIENLYLTQPYLRLSTEFSYEPKILGSAGGLMQASNKMKTNQPILFMNADEVYFTQQQDYLNAALEDHKKTGALATLVVVKHPEAGKKFGAISCNGRLVKNISKKLTDPNLVPWHFIGVMILSWNVLSLIPDGKEQNIFYDVLVNHLDKLRIFPITAEWYETGNKNDFLTASEIVLSQINKYAGLQSFINQYDLSTPIINAKTTALISKSHKVNPSNLTGFVSINKTAKINPNGLFENAAYFDNQIIKYE